MAFGKNGFRPEGLLSKGVSKKNDFQLEELLA